MTRYENVAQQLARTESTSWGIVHSATAHWRSTIRGMNDVGTESELHQMIQQQIIGRGITDQRVIEAFYSVPRELFFLDTFRKKRFW